MNDALKSLVWEELETQNANKGVGGFIPAVSAFSFYFLFVITYRRRMKLKLKWKLKKIKNQNFQNTK